MHPLRFGIVGCGVIAPIHGKALRKLKEEGVAELVAAADVNADRAKAFTQEYGGVPLGSIDEILARPDIDVVTLCTPSGLHASMAKKAALAGKHILSEKPLDVWLKPAEEAIKAAADAGVTYGCIFQERFSPGARRLKRAIEAGAFGEIVLACAETKWYRSQEYYDSGDWRGTWALDAGVFSNQGIHSLDKVQWLAGPVEEVLSATLLPGHKRKIESETIGVATVRFAGGALGTITMTTLSFSGFPERIDISGTDGSAILTGDNVTHFVTRLPYDDGQATDDHGDSADDGDKASNPAAVFGDHHVFNIRDFALAVRAGQRPQITAVDATQAVKLLNMIYEKAKVGPFA